MDNTWLALRVSWAVFQDSRGCCLRGGVYGAPVFDVIGWVAKVSRFVEDTDSTSTADPGINV